ncbi:MAG TPA: hypothetical protein VFI73_09050, partial [Candidatus Nitrosopolaris sp.]|nr:hypothetical protein [Candidatus Nitrosopolaris sp.]
MNYKLIHCVATNQFASVFAGGGNYFWVKDSKLYTKPPKSIPLYISGLGEQTARLAGEEGDGFVTNEL